MTYLENKKKFLDIKKELTTINEQNNDLLNKLKNHYKHIIDQFLLENKKIILEK